MSISHKLFYRIKIIQLHFPLSLPPPPSLSLSISLSPSLSPLDCACTCVSLFPLALISQHPLYLFLSLFSVSPHLIFMSPDMFLSFFYSSFWCFCPSITSIPPSFSFSLYPALFKSLAPIFLPSSFQPGTGTGPGAELSGGPALRLKDSLRREDSHD